MSVFGQSCNLLSSILTILLTCPNSGTWLCYSNDTFLAVIYRDCGTRSSRDGEQCVLVLDCLDFTMVTHSCNVLAVSTSSSTDHCMCLSYRM